LIVRSLFRLGFLRANDVINFSAFDTILAMVLSNLECFHRIFLILEGIIQQSTYRLYLHVLASSNLRRGVVDSIEKLFF